MAKRNNKDTQLIKKVERLKSTEMMKRLMVDPVDEPEDLRDGEVFSGTAAAYVIGARDIHEITVGDYEVDLVTESRREELRATRQRRQREGKPVSKLSRYALRDETIIIFGPHVSPEDAVSALQRAIRTIENDGLLIGRDKKGGLTWEWAEDEHHQS
jgi:hypothetical protein